MEHTLTAKDLKGLSQSFRSVASRFLHSDSEEAIGNLRRLLSFIDGSPVLYDFIQKHHSQDYDVAQITQERRRTNGRRFVLPTAESEEITFTYQLLRYAAGLDDLFSITYGYNNYKTQADFEAFAQSVVFPFVNHITRYLEMLLDDTGRTEGGSTTITISGTVQQLNFAQHGSTVIATNVGNPTQDISTAADKLLESLSKDDIPQSIREELQEVAQIARDESKADKPRKGIFKMCVETIPALLDKLPKLVTAAKAGQELVETIQKWLAN